MTDDKNKESPKEIIPQSGQEFLNLETILQLVKAAEVAGSPDIQELSRDKEASGTLGSSGNGVVSETSGLQNSLPLGRVEAPGASRNMGYCVMPDLTQSLRVFNGKGGASDALQWLQDIKTMAGRQFWGDAILLEVARQHLVDSALLWYRYHQDTLTTWAAFEMRFRENYTDRRTLAERFREMSERKQRTSESAEDYFYAKMAMCRDLKLSFAETKEMLLTGLKSREVARSLLTVRHDDEWQLLRDLRNNERLDLISVPERRILPEKRKCFRCGAEGHISKNCNTPRVENNTKCFPCFKCGKMGHFARECQVPGRDSRERQVVGRNENSQRGATANEVAAQVKTINAQSDNLKYFKDVKINGVEVRGYVDMGAEVCVIRDDYVPKLKLMCDWDKKKDVTGYGGAVTSVLGAAQVDVEIDGINAQIELLVVPRETQEIPVIIGHPYTEQPHIEIVKTPHELIIRKCEENGANNAPRTVLWASEASVIRNNFLGHITVRTQTPESTLCVEGGLRESGEWVPRCVISTDRNGDTVLPILNISGKDIKIVENQSVARGDVCREYTHRRDVNTEPIDACEINTDLAGKDAEKVLELINDYRDLVARNVKQIGCTNLVEMDIELTDDKPVVYRPYRMSFSEKEQVRNIVRELKEADIIEETDSPFASPVILVKKKSGEVRMCVDYRALNKKTVKQHYPLPLIDDQLDRLRGQIYFTSVDLSMGYHQVPMSRDARGVLSGILQLLPVLSVTY
ncbi:hypothetical protein TcasGA2_TC034546 [Tribolium castaneum]|uniref:Uncharacterized protein n=1 Tax=Tribolium castaneum TaxID=7070 RepID=A0A139WN73_TRICA|nr:hypothetical protein TcasGA2_TC034546 [Tribolium castaneum]